MKLAIISFITFGFITSSSIATTFSFQQGVDGYSGTVDTFIRGADNPTDGGPDTDHSTTEKIAWDQSSNGQPVHGLLRFENIFGSDPGQIPLDLAVTNATLTLVSRDGTGDPGLLFRMLVAWNDTDTWNTWGDGIAPHNSEGGIQTDGAEAATVFDAQTPSILADPNQVLTIDVTASLQAWQQQPGTNFGWVFQATDVDAGVVHSSEGLTPPKLDVTVIPSPATALILTPFCLLRGRNKVRRHLK